MKRTAFTLLELLLVLAIIATICGLGITSYQRQYARARFKSGIVKIQVDLHKTRLLAMQSGDAYLFRYVPGTNVYEIAPLNTLQEVLYRIHGDVEELNDDTLGGSITYGSSDPSFLTSESVYSDDLFSVENIQADLNARERKLKESKATQELSAPGLGGNLTSVQAENVGNVFSSGSNVLNGSGYSSSNVVFGSDVAMSLGTSLDATSSTNFRELNAQEKSLVKENSLAWRVNEDGVVIRKQATGDVVFTLLRVSRSTPSNLRTNRPKGSSDKSTTSVLEGVDGFQMENALGGSLTSIPDGTESGEGLGGGLNEIPGEDASVEESGGLSDKEQFVSFWSEPIIFYPNGKTSSAVLGFESVGDYPYYSEIALRGMTGVARISSISAEPPEVDPRSSVLTREQLFRLSNPMNQNNETSSAGLATSGSVGGALGSTSTGMISEVSDSLDGMNELNISSGDILSGEQTPGVHYGTGRRSGYSFNEGVSSSTNDVPLGVSFDQSVVSNGNISTGVDSSNNGATELKRPETTNKNPILNGGNL